MSWSAVATIITAVTGVTSATVAYVGAQKAADAQEKAAVYNARNAQMQADEERKTAAENARRTRVASQRKLAQMRARAGASGLAFDGSLMDSIAESAGVLEKEVGDVFRHGLARGDQADAQASMSLFEGGVTASATRTSANANLLSGLATTAGNTYQTRKLT